jgi:16S rRNA (adenine1518-N6/adenine1519-N6)-dimethyltransferase
MEEIKFKKKKSLGQNFLHNKNILEFISKSGAVKENDYILEIGGGEGALTEYLLREVESRVGARLCVVETDVRLVEILKSKFSSSVESGVLEILHIDVLRWGSDKHMMSRGVGSLKYKIVANIPYYITGAIIEKFLSVDTKPISMILMIQKEVADRIVSRGDKGSILSMCTKYYGDTEILKVVGKGNFNPPPKVDSAIIKITLNEKNLKDNKYLELEKRYLEIVKSGFAHKRKFLISNLKEYDSATNWEEIFNKNKIDVKVRAEILGSEDFIKLARG